jgi:TolB protein
LTQVTFTSAGNDFDPVVSRDGSTIVFASTQHRPAPDLYLARVGSRAVTQLTTDPASDAMPAISPDGRMIAFASDRSGTWQVYVMPAAGGRAVALTDDSAPAMHPTFSPDGARVAFSRLGQMTGRWELWVAQVATPAQAEFIGFGLRPAWCPVPGTGEMGSDRIAFQRARERGDRAFGLWTIDYKPGNVGSPVQIVAAETAAAINPAWSPDGKLIAYASVPVGGGRAGRSAGKSAELAGLWITTADGASRVNVSSGRDNALAPAWAATDRLFFVSSRAGREQVWSVGTQRAVAALPVGGAGEGAMKLTGGAAVGPAPVAGPIAAGAEAGPAAVPGAGGGAGGEAPAGARPAGGEPATVSVPTSEGPTREQGEPVATAPEIE